jgi:DNA-binding transcriptional LysR family regulator
MHSVSWEGFRYFLAVARTGRVAIAAKRLGVEHSTVSRRLEALETELGTRLFYRTVAGYRLTSDGEAALGPAEAMETAERSLRAHVGESSGRTAGLVRLALLDEFASHWLAPALPAFRARYPDIQLEVITGIQQLDLSRGEADLAVRTPRPRQAELSALKLGSVTTGLYASRALVGGRRLWVEDVASARGLPLLVYVSAYQALQSASWFQPLLATGPLGLVTNSSHTLLASARAGLGIAVLPRIMARRYDELVAVSDELSRHDHWLVAHPDVRREPKTRAVADFLKRAARGADGFK